MSDNDDDSDSDYDPCKDKEKDNGSDCDEDHPVIQKVSELKDMSFSRKRQVNSIWDEMNAMDKTETQQRLEKLKHQRSVGSNVSVKKKSKAEKVLAGIFGKTQASLIAGSSSSSQSSSCKMNCDESSLKETIQKSVQSIQKRQKVNETRKFAGQEIS